MRKTSIRRFPVFPFFLALALPAVVACASTKGEETAPSTQEEAGPSTHELRPSFPIEIAGAAAAVPSLAVGWVELLDSRCPVGVNCFVAGQAQLRLEVRRDGGDPEEVVLVLAAGDPIGPHDEVATVGEYRLELLEVHPYPRAEQQVADEDRSAILRVGPAEGPDPSGGGVQ